MGTSPQQKSDNTCSDSPPALHGYASLKLLYDTGVAASAAARTIGEYAASGYSAAVSVTADERVIQVGAAAMKLLYDTGVAASAAARTIGEYAASGYSAAVSVTADERVIQVGAAAMNATTASARAIGGYAASGYSAAVSAIASTEVLQTVNIEDDSVRQFAKITLVTAATVIGIRALSSSAIPISAMNAIGFGKTGIQANSIAALIQSPFTAPNSMFSILQSAGARGIQMNIMTYAWGLGGGILSGCTAYVAANYAEKLYPPSDESA